MESNDALFQEWIKENFGTKDRFYEFLTIPSRRRSEFLAQHNAEVTNNGIYVTQNYTV